MQKKLVIHFKRACQIYDGIPFLINNVEDIDVFLAWKVVNSDNFLNFDAEIRILPYRELTFTNIDISFILDQRMFLWIPLWIDDVTL